MRGISSAMGKALVFGLGGLLALTLFLTGFEEGINVYIGGVAWYVKIVIGVVIAWFIGKKLL